MRESEKFLRRSPRLFSSGPVKEASPAKTMPAPSSNCLALVIHASELEPKAPAPLKVYDPSENSARRSSRFTTNKYRSAPQGNVNSNEASALQEIPILRKSPRFAAAGRGKRYNLGGSSSAALLDLVMKGNILEKKRKNGSSFGKIEGIALVGEKCLRSRSVPGSVVRTGSGSGATLLGLHGELGTKKARKSLGKSEEKVWSRRSPSLVACLDVKSELLALPEPPPRKGSSKKIGSDLARKDSNVSEKSLSFRTIELWVGGVKETVEEKLALAEWTEMKTPENNDETSELGVLNEKCLRSRKIPFRVVADENATTEMSNSGGKRQVAKRKTFASSEKQKKPKSTSCFVGDPVPVEEAQERWHWRYELKSQRSERPSWRLNADEEDEIILNVECHYTQAKIDGHILNLGDCALVKGKGRKKHVGRIIEFFKTTEGENYFRVQWFFRAEDTVMKEAAAFHDNKRLFYSTLMNDNLLDCLISKVNVREITPELGLQSNSFLSSDFYYDMEYCLEYSTFRNLLIDNSVKSCVLSSPNFSHALHSTRSTNLVRDVFNSESCEMELALLDYPKKELTLLDLYSGCGAMSTGLSLGAKLAGVNLVTRWAVDFKKSACDSLRLNHPETQVRNEPAEDFLGLLKKWEELCKLYVSNDLENTMQSESENKEEDKRTAYSPNEAKISRGEYEVAYLVDVCYDGDFSEAGKSGLKFKVRWSGYGSDEDTWEPIEGLSNCEERIQDFVRSGFAAKILPLPGDVDVICGGPPCQGISGYNRFRNVDDPLADERNRQIVVFMDIVKFLMPKFVLMENVVDILRFDKASLGRYAVSRLVHMKYQARLGTMAAGCYGLPQFRLRVFLWGALSSEKLPQFPLPTHDVVVKYWPPPEFERNTVAYDEGQHRDLEEAVVLRDAISDLPDVTSHEAREEMTYVRLPETEFQSYVRLTKNEMVGWASPGDTEIKNPVLYDHRPYRLSEDDYLRVCQIPRKKGANFRDLPGIIVGADNVVHRDTTKPPMLLPSGKPIVPDYAFTFEQGKSKKPFARLWWDETVATVITFPNLHSQQALHPEQDRVLTIREYARLQGFPDFYRFCGSIKERYRQVGNAVAVPVARALGYALGMAVQKQSDDEPLMTLPPKFSTQEPPIDDTHSAKIE